MAFAIDIEGRQYLVTAKHVVEGIQSGDAILIASLKGQHALSVTVIPVEPAGADSIVLVLPELIAKGDQPEPDMAGLAISQDVFFLGFPFAWTPKMKTLDTPFPLPFVKGGVVSALENQPHTGPTFFIDGQSNIGFSGGPVIFDDVGVGEQKLKIAGIVHGNVAVEEPVSDIGGDTGLHVMGDAGLIKVFGLRPVLAAIEKNPIGVPTE